MSREAIHIRAQALSPLLIAQRPGSLGQPDESLDYIPGGTLRGALAARLLQDQGAPPDPQHDATFRALFLQDRVRYSALLPGNDSAPALPVPHTVWNCKTFSWRLGHPLVDLLPALLHWNVDLLAVRCPVCVALNRRARREGPGAATDRPLDKPYDGKLDRVAHGWAVLDKGAWTLCELPRRLINRTSIAAGRQTARPTQLYSLQPLDGGTYFYGIIVADSELAGQVRELVGERTLLRVGSDRNRGLGQVEITTLASNPNLPLPSVAERVTAFNTFLRAQEPTHMLPADETYIPLTLCSDAVLLDDDLLPAPATDRAILERYRRLGSGDGVVPPDLELVAQSQTTRTVRGWDLLRGLPRPAQAAAALGSVWVYRLPVPPARVAAETWDWLAGLEREGVGERRAEGFGAVRVAHPLHLSAPAYTTPLYLPAESAETSA